MAGEQTPGRRDEVPAVLVGAMTIMAARPRVLARFYSRLLSWPYIREEEPGVGDPEDAGYALICPPDGVMAPAINFDYHPHFRRPRWPSAGDEPASTMHLDLGVDDLDVGVAWAIECGAELAEVQPRPSQHRVMIDPEGHPFCLCLP